ncbi:hypothetical protein NS359_16010, partial [Curtobacterium oceanosedimentum]
AGGSGVGCAASVGRPQRHAPGGWRLRLQGGVAAVTGCGCARGRLDFGLAGVAPTAGPGCAYVRARPTRTATRRDRAN